MNDDRFEERLRDAATEYHRPPETPREEMWAAIVAARRQRSTRRILVLPPAWRWGLGMAAVLLVGVAIGWWVRPETGRLVPTTSAVATHGGADVPYRLAAAQYFSRTETLLAGFRTDARSGRVDTLFVAQARELLTSTRLLLGSPVGHDPRLKPLLEDLELVLAQIALLSGGRDTEDVDLITQGMDQQSVLTRLRTAIPTGPAAGPRTQGVL
jgi:hypothetical protein